MKQQRRDVETENFKGTFCFHSGRAIRRNFFQYFAEHVALMYADDEKSRGFEDEKIDLKGLIYLTDDEPRENDTPVRTYRVDVTSPEVDSFKISLFRKY